MLSIIVVSYNTRQMTIECLRSVVEHAPSEPFEVLIIDNASTDGSAQAIRDEFAVRDGRFVLIEPGSNLGFAAANNLAAERARGELLLLLNPDTIVLDDALNRLVAFARRTPRAMIWGGRTLTGDRVTLDPQSVWRRMTLWSLLCQALGLTTMFPRWGLFNPEAYGSWERDSEREVDIVTGCLLLITRDLWQRLGGFDPLFFMYGEEADLCLRARTLGARPRFTPDATIVHYGGASEKIFADKVVRLLKAKASLIDRHFHPLARPIARWLLLLWPSTRALGGRLRARSGGTARAHNAQAWAEVHRRRAEWLRGWTVAGENPA